MFIDVHCHAYRKCPPFVTPFPTPEQVLAVYDELEIDKGVLLPVVSSEIYFPQSNEEILDMVAQYPDRFAAFCNLDPRALTNSPDAPLGEVLQYYKDLGCRCVGEVMCNLSMMDPLVQNLFRHAEVVGLPVTFDGSDRVGGDFGLYDEPGMPYLEHTLQRFPNLVILGHGPTFWVEIGRLDTPAERGGVFAPDGSYVGGIRPTGPIKEEGVMPKLMRRYPNLYGDMSDNNPYMMLVRDPDYGPQFLNEFQDKLLFGTDYCCVGMEMPLAGLLREWCEAGKISEEVFRKIAWENAVRLLGL